MRLRKKIIDKVMFSNLNTWDVKRFKNIDIRFNKSFKVVPFAKVLKEPSIDWVKIEDDKMYPILGVRTYGKGIFINRTSSGSELKMKKYQKSKKDHLFWCKVDTKNGAFGVITEEFEESFGSSNMSYMQIKTESIVLPYLQLLFQLTKFNEYMDNMVVGVTNRKYISKNDLLTNIYIPLPSIKEQNLLVSKYNEKLAQAESFDKEIERLEESIEDYLFDSLGIVKNTFKETEKILKLIPFTKVSQWGFDKIGIEFPFSFNKASAYSIYQRPKWCISLTRGKSPKYAENSNSLVLNQKCNRWDEIDLTYAKKVDPIWLSKVNEEVFTMENDILINSTGEGTLGRSSLIKSDEFTNLLYDSHMLCLRVNSEYVNSQLLVYLINSSFGQTQVEILKGAQATNQTELGIDNMKKILFPLPDIEIQVQIANNITEIKEKVKLLRQKSMSLRTLAKKEFEDAIFLN